MTRTTSILTRVGGLFAVLGAARRTAAAVEAHRLPASRDLKTLGISPEAFRSIDY